MNVEETQASSLRIFYSYAHSDASMLNKLHHHLRLLRQQGLIVEWHDRDIDAGADWKEQTDAPILMQLT